MDQSTVKILGKMTRIRDLAGSVADLLNSSQPHGVTVSYSRAFLHVGNGFGIYPRFRRAEEWDDLEQRVARFFDAMKLREEDWLRFIEWRGSFRGLGVPDPNQAPVAYERLLELMLSTPSAWGDNEYLQIHQRAGLPFGPFVAEFRRDLANEPWTMRTWRSGADGLAQFGSAAITEGALPPDAPVGAASIFWECLYPLCNRLDFFPPQDPTKGKMGAIFQLILPIYLKGAEWPQAWVLCIIEPAVRDQLLNEFLNGIRDLDAWRRIHDQLLAAMSGS